MPRTVSRILELKMGRFRAGRRKNFVAPRLDVLCEQLWNATTQIGQRHWPLPVHLHVGTSCMFVNMRIVRANATTARKDGCIIEVVSYQHATTPEQTVPDFTAAHTTIDTPPIVDAQGNTRQVVHSFRVGFLGHSCIVEVVKGGGGVASLAHALTELFRANGHPDLPELELIDVIGKNLRRQIDAGGGVDRVVARLVGESQKRAHPGASRMTKLKQRVGGTEVLVASLESGDRPLDAQSAIDFWEENQNDGALDSVVLHMKDGAKIDRLGRFKERRKFDIQLTAAGRIAVTEVEQAIWNYMDELRVLDAENWRLLDDDGKPLYGIAEVGGADGA